MLIWNESTPFRTTMDGDVTQLTDDLRPLFQPPLWVRFAFPLAAILLAFACFPFDLEVASYFRHHPQPKFVGELVENTEPFGHGVGVVLILVILGLCQPQLRRSYLHAGLIVLTAGMATNVIKLSYGRIRPRDLDWQAVNQVQETFLGWVPILRGMEPETSFPSGHTTVAFALAVCLSVLHPPARWVFFGLAAFVGFGRVFTSAHYPSDVLAGAAMGWSVSLLLIMIPQRNALSKLYQSVDRNRSNINSTNHTNSLHTTPISPTLQAAPSCQH